MKSRTEFDAIALGALGLVVVGLLLRVTFLSADPTYPFWNGWIADEGRWTGTARNVVLFGAPHIDSALARTHLILAPLYQAVMAAAFWAFGVVQTTARGVSALAGIGILYLAFAVLYRRVSGRNLVVALSLLALQPDLVFFSRVAIPEVPALLLETAAFAVLVLGSRTRLTALGAGLVLAAGLGMKGTTAPIVPIFAAIVWLLHRPDDPASRAARLTAFLVPIVTPGLLFVGVAIVRGGGGGGIGDILGFLALDDLYGMVTTLIEGGWTARVNLMLVVLWGLALVAWVRGLPDGRTSAIFVGSLVWVAGWIGAWILLDYFPERYVMHVHVPLVFAIVSGLELLGRPAPRSFDEALAGRRGGRRLVLASLFALPAAVVVVPALLTSLEQVGLEWVNLRYRLALIPLVSVLIGVGLARRWTAGSVAAVSLVFPSAVALMWTAAEWLDLAPVRFWSVEGPALLAVWGGILVAALAVAASRFGSSGGAGPRWVLTYAVALASLWAVQGVSRHQVRPEVRAEIVEFLAERYAADAVIGNQDVSGLLLSSPFRYREVEEEEDRDYDAFLGLERLTSPEETRGLTLVGEFEMVLGPDHDDAAFDRELVHLYER